MEVVFWPVALAVSQVEDKCLYPPASQYYGRRGELAPVGGSRESVWKPLKGLEHFCSCQTVFCGPCFPLMKVYLFSSVNNKYYWACLITLSTLYDLIKSFPKLHSAPLNFCSDTHHVFKVVLSFNKIREHSLGMRGKEDLVLFICACLYIPSRHGCPVCEDKVVTVNTYSRLLSQPPRWAARCLPRPRSRWEAHRRRTPCQQMKRLRLPLNHT